jgi:carbonic anhydrase
VQFHFHTPSEHLIDGKPYEMEMHLVHVNDDGQIAVLGFIFTVNPTLKEIDVSDGVQREVADDSPNEFLNQFWSQLPFEKTTEDIPLNNPLNFQCLFEKSTTKTIDRSTRSDKQEIDMQIYEYMGSLTTPPYTEGVQWLVSKKVHMFNAQQLADLSSCWNNKNNARDVQEYCGRTVLIRQSSNVLIA